MSATCYVDLGSFQHLIGNGKPTSMSDLLAVHRIIQDNIQYAVECRGRTQSTIDLHPDESVRKQAANERELFNKVFTHLKEDEEFILGVIANQIKMRQDEKEKIRRDADKAFEEHEKAEEKKKE